MLTHTELGEKSGSRYKHPLDPEAEFSKRFDVSNSNMFVVHPADNCTGADEDMLISGSVWKTLKPVNVVPIRNRSLDHLGDGCTAFPPRWTVREAYTLDLTGE